MVQSKNPIEYKRISEAESYLNIKLPEKLFNFSELANETISEYECLVDSI
jgi:hypothetical protein